MIKKSISKGQGKLVDTGFLDSLGQDKDAIKLNKAASVIVQLADTAMEDIAKGMQNKKAVASGNSIRDMYQELTTDRRFLETAVYIYDYLKYIDEGVNGVKVNRGSRFSFKNYIVSKSFVNSIRKWAIRKNLSSSAFKRKVGQESESRIATNEAAAFMIAKKIKSDGIMPRKFIQDAVTKLEQNLGSNKILQAFKIDVIASLPDGSEFK